MILYTKSELRRHHVGARPPMRGHGRRAGRLAILASFASLLCAEPAAAATHCVGSAAGFASALEGAAGNGQDDEIRLTRGSYEETSSLRFLYLADATEAFDLDISGDWNTGCTAQGSSPSATIIDGNGIDHGLDIWFAGSFATVRLLTFVGGMAPPGNERGGGLQVASVGNDDALVFRVESNQFVANEAAYGGALSVSEATIIQVVNNVFVANSASIDFSSAELIAADSGAVYFTNNTVIDNGPTGDVLEISAELGANVINNNFHGNSGRDLYVRFDPGWDPVDILRNNNISDWSIPNFPIVENNIDVDPEYQSGFLNFTPVRNSPLVDTGVEPEFLAFWYLTDADINESPRVVGAHVDIGAFENDKILVDGFDPSGPFDRTE
jgi:hypothetical protein